MRRKIMKKRMLAFFLSIVMVITLFPTNFVLADTKTETDIEEDVKKSDKEIETKNVPVQEIEWENGKVKSKTVVKNSGKNESHKIVMVLDVSGSMSGRPMTELKKSCNNFIDDILDEDADAQVAIVTYADKVTVNTFSGQNFTNKRSSLHQVVSGLSASGGTAMNAGLAKADEILQQSGGADRCIILQMADGEPNVGNSYSGSGAKYSNGYASEVYNTFSSISNLYEIYSLGFFHDNTDHSNTFAGRFLNDIQNAAYFEVTDADKLTFSFEKIAENINTDRLQMTQTAMTLEEGMTRQLGVKFSDNYTSNDRNLTWGSNNTNVAKVDKEGNVQALKEGNCVISAEAGGYMATCNLTVTAKAKKLSIESITVEENKNSQSSDNDEYALSQGAKISYEGNSVTTDETGSVTLRVEQDKGEITVSKNGYRTRTIPLSSLDSSHSTTIYLQKDSKNPVINSVICDDTDVLIDEKSVSLVSTDSVVFSADVDWGSAGAGSIKLVQNAKAQDFNGTTLSMVLKNKFDVSQDLYILATDASGHSTKKKIKIVASTALKGLDGKISFGDDVKLTLPDAFPLIGGGDVKFGLEEVSKCPFDIAIDNGKVIATFGIDIVKYTKTKNTTKYTSSGRSRTTTKEEIEILYQKLKDATGGAKKDVKKKMKSIGKEYEKALKTRKSSFGFDANFQTIGYVEGYIDNGSFRFMDGRVVITPSVSASWSGEFVVGPVPCYWEAKIAAEIQAQLNILQADDVKGFTSKGELSGTLSGSAGAGVGVNQVATIGGGANLKFNPGITFEKNPKDNYVWLTTSINGYFKVKILALEYQHDFDPIVDWTIDNSPKRSVRKFAITEDSSEKIYDTASYQLEDTSYLKNNQVELKTVSEDESQQYADKLQTFDENSYSQTNPKIVSLEADTKLAVWIDSASDDKNDIRLYYSYYDGNSWSQPAIIDEDGTADFAPSICVSNNKAYVIWQNLETKITQDSTLDSLAAHVGIKAAQFTPSSGKFVVTSLSDDSGYLDMKPTIQGSNGKVVAAWVENTKNQWFTTDESNNIKTAVFNGSSWEKALTKIKNQKSINSLAVDLNGNDIQLAYTEDVDGNLTTINDQELYVNGNRMTDNQVVDSAPQFMNHILYWYSDGKIKTASDLSDFKEESITGDDNKILSDVYKIIENGDNKVLIYPVPDGAVSELYSVFYDKKQNQWGKPLQLTNQKSSIQTFDALWNSDGIDLICNQVALNGEKEEISENTYGKTDVTFLNYNYNESDKITLDDLIYDKSEIYPRSSLPITLEVSNKGSKTIQQIKVDILDETGKTVDTVTYHNTLLSGESADFEFLYKVKNEDLGKKYTVRCYQKDNEKSTDEQSLKFNYEDLNLAKLSWSMQAGNTNNARIYGKIQNLGFNAQKNIEVSLHKGSIDRTKVASYTIREIPSMSQSDIQFEVPFEENALYYVTVSEGTNEENISNNQDFVVLNKQKVSAGRILEDITVTKDTLEYAEKDTLKLDDITVMAKYDDGTSADVTSEVTIKTADIDMTQPGTYKITITYQGKTKYITIHVKKSTDQNVESTTDENVKITQKTKSTIKLTGLSHKIAAGKRIKLTAVIVPKNVLNQNITWKSSNTKVATVDKNGLVTIKKKTGGKSVAITAIINNDSHRTAVYQIKVMKGVVKKIKISGAKSVKAGKTMKLRAKVTASKGANKTLKWVSGNTKYATVSSAGKIKTFKEGKNKSVQITAMATDGGGKKKSVKVKIK